MNQERVSRLMRAFMRRRALSVLVAVMAVIPTMFLGSLSFTVSTQESHVVVQINSVGGVAIAAPGIGADFSQCANGTPPGTSLVCPDGWINGILNPNNSHYHEDDVTPQRFVIDFPGGAGFGQTGHTILFRYQARKGSADAHSYDSLATWNYTQSGLSASNRCDDLSGPCPPASPENSFAVPNEPTCMESQSRPRCVTTSHMIHTAV